MPSWKRIIAALALLTSACSYTFGVAPHEPSLSGTPSGCTTSRVPPVIDTVLTLAAVALATSAVYDCETSSKSDDQRCIFAVMTVPLAGLTALGLGASAHKGFRDTAECAREAADARRSDDQVSSGLGN